MSRIINHFDGLLYIIMAICTQAQVELSTSDASQVFSSIQLYWIKGTFALLLAGATAAKMYRSTAYADSKTKTATPDAPAPTTAEIKQPVV